MRSSIKRGVGMLQRVRWRLHRLIFQYIQQGNSVECLVCGWQGRRFYVGARCPRCRSLARTRFLFYALRAFDVSLNEMRLLHVGANPGEVHYVQQQYAPSGHLRIDLLPTKAANVIADIGHLPLDDHSMDTALLWHVLEHIPNDRQATKELARTLKPGGRTIFSVPIHPHGREETWEDPTIPRAGYEEAYGHPDHVRACGLDYGDRFAAAGFDVRLLHVENAPEEHVRRYGLMAFHAAWCCMRES